MTRREPRGWGSILSSRIAWTLLGLIAVLPLAFRLDKEIRAAERTSVEQDLSPRVQIWIKSVDCALRTGTFLTVCGGDGKIHPIEDASPADDRGHVLLLTLQAMMTGKIPSAVDIVKMNLALNSIALLLAGLACLYSGWRVAAFVVVFLGARSVIPGFRGPEIAASFAGLYCLMVAAGILMSDLLEDGGRSRRVTIAALSCVMLLIGFISLLRQPLGIAAALLCSALLLIKGRGLAWGSKRSLGLLAALLLGPWVACRSPHFMTSMRDILFDAPKAAHGIPAHGLGHALLLGLGEESNPFGIRWEDAYGEELVKRERPEIEYLSAEYFRFAWIRYLGIVFGSPIIVSKIYIEKTRKALETMAMGWGGFATLSLWLGYFGASRFGRPGHAEGPRMDACLVFGISATLILLQGVLGWPYPIYIYPCFMGFMFYRLCLALTAWSLRKHELAICALLWAILNLCWGFVRSVEAVFGPGGIKFLEGSNLVLETAFMVLSLLALRGDRSFGPKMEMRLGR